MAIQEKKTRFWIIGAGRFGCKAFERLKRKNPNGTFVIVDPYRDALARLGDVHVELVLEEGARFMAAHMEGPLRPDWIIPAVPVHLAVDWMRAKATKPRRIEVIPVPADVDRRLPNPRRGPEGELYVSYADFVCPDNCAEPIDRCTFTGKPRKGLLYKTIEEVAPPGFLSVVIRSRQLAPGVGGYKPEDLERGMEKVLQAQTPVLFSTACLCHGVIHCVRLRYTTSSAIKRRRS